MDIENDDKCEHHPADREILSGSLIPVTRVVPIKLSNGKWKFQVESSATSPSQVMMILHSDNGTALDKVVTDLRLDSGTLMPITPGATVTLIMPAVTTSKRNFELFISHNGTGRLLLFTATSIGPRVDKVD